jgi:methionyl-tRNA formyltransferase
MPPRSTRPRRRVDWTRPADEIDRLIRGLSPFPGRLDDAGGRRLKLLRSRRTEGQGAPGEVLDGLTIACGSGAVDILEVQAEGRARQDAASFLRGTPLAPGTRWEG